MNLVVLMGRPTTDPIAYKSASGTTIAAYTLAVHQIYHGEQQNTDFIRCVAFGRIADFVLRYVQKGQRIAVEGRLQTSKYVDKDGITRYSTQVVVARHEFADAPRANSAPVAPATPAAGAPVPAADEMTNIVEEDEDLPF